MRPVALAGILASTTILGGCAGTIAGISLSSISSVAGFASTLFTGADLGEHAVSILTGQDCRFSEGLLRDDRDVCEEPGSLATRDDFHGIFVERIDADGTVIYAAPKYMKPTVVAGLDENNPDAVWAQIKEQKAQEETERQVARANAAQTIDVAALATGSLSSQSLAFLPGGVKISTTVSTSDVIDGETASQTAKSPRPVANVVTVKVKAPVQAPTTVRTPTYFAAAPVDAGQPAIDEAALTASIKAAQQTGEGGPFIATMTNTTPVASKLVKGEPVVVLRIGPVFSTNMPAASETPSDVALPSENAVSLTEPVVDEPVSPLTAVMQTPPSAPRSIPRMEKAALTTPVKPAPVVEETPVEPKKIEPRAKPALTTAPKKPKAAPKVEAAQTVVTNRPDDVDVYQPPLRESAGSLASSPAPDLTGTVMSTPVPDEPAHKSTTALTTEPNSAPMPSATTGPAALVPTTQQ
jgi:hypothetical protein